MTEDISRFLNERILEDVNIASQGTTPWFEASSLTKKLGLSLEDSALIERQSPGSVLRDLDLKRQIIKLCTDAIESNDSVALATMVLRLLSSNYEESPRFEVEWTVGEAGTESVPNIRWTRVRPPATLPAVRGFRKDWTPPNIQPEKYAVGDSVVVTDIHGESWRGTVEQILDEHIAVRVQSDA
jgi:hypothetical protein